MAGDVVGADIDLLGLRRRTEDGRWGFPGLLEHYIYPDGNSGGTFHG